jgi:hypothetical protein
MMDACLQDTEAVLERERQTLLWVRNKATKIQRLFELSRSAEDACRRFDKHAGMGVYLRWQVTSEEHNHFWIHVGGLIQVSDGAIDNMSYYLCVTRASDASDVQRHLRKYHFDYANPRVRAKRRSSVFHLQYPGKLPGELKGDDFDDETEERMDAWLEEPRIFYLPMSLALLLHLAFREFPDQYTNRLCEDGEWQSIHVHRDQQCLILPYLEKCVEVAASPKKKLLWDVTCEPK